jgi:hypothetical protein
VKYTNFGPKNEKKKGDKGRKFRCQQRNVEKKTQTSKCLYMQGSSRYISVMRTISNLKGRVMKEKKGKEMTRRIERDKRKRKGRRKRKRTIASGEKQNGSEIDLRAEESKGGKYICLYICGIQRK